MCKSLSRAGHDVHLVVADGKGDAVDSDVHIHDVGSPSSRVMRVLASGCKVFRKALQLKADIYHFHDPDLIPFGLMLKLLGKCVVYDIHEFYSDTLLEAYYLAPWARRAVSRLYDVAEYVTVKALDACVVVTPFMKAHSHARRCVVIENFVILSEFDPSGPFAQKENAACYVGIIDYTRGINEMVDAVHRSGVTLYLAGNYYASSQLRSELMRKEGWARVKEEGYVGRQRINDIFARSKVGLLILLPKKNYMYASCNKLFEYMAASIPVIVSGLPFACAVVEKYRCGLLLKPSCGAEEVAAAIDWIMANPGEAELMGQRGRQAVEAEYSWESQERKLLSLYEQILPPRQGQPA